MKLNAAIANQTADGQWSPGLMLQRKCDCGNHTMGGTCDDCAKKKSSLQRKPASGFESSDIPPIVHDVLRSPGQELDPATREFMGTRLRGDFSRVPIHSQTKLTLGRADDAFEREADAAADRIGFGGRGSGLVYDFKDVHVHTDEKASRSARALNALAYTVGNQIVFDAGQYAPSTSTGRRLIAHELSHVVQQRGNQPLIQRQPRARARALARRRLEVRPSENGAPCACLVFVHNDETNARVAAEELHRTCRYNLAIRGPGGGREVSIPGSGRIDPNQLFPADVQEECERDEPACTTYLESHDDLRAAQIQFFFSIRDCSNRFSLPTVALHNNVIGDTRALMNSTTSSEREALRGDFARETTSGPGSREDLRTRLGPRGGMMRRGGTTNIFRWCNLPEISRCHVGDPEHPDNVIWATTAADFDTLSLQPVNVVLQEGLGASATGGSESEHDLSTSFLRQPNSRFVNIETPGSPRTAATQADNLSFIREALGHIGLRCCDPPAAIEPTLPNPLPYVEATRLYECVQALGPQSGDVCRRQIMSEMDGERDLFGRSRRPSMGRPPLD